MNAVDAVDAHRRRSSYCWRGSGGQRHVCLSSGFERLLESIGARRRLTRVARGSISPAVRPESPKP